MGDGEIFIAVITLIFWVILFVKFFQMAADIRKIKKRIGQPDSDDNSDAPGAPVTPSPTAFAENLIGR